MVCEAVRAHAQLMIEQVEAVERARRRRRSRSRLPPPEQTSGALAAAETEGANSMRYDSHCPRNVTDEASEDCSAALADDLSSTDGSHVQEEEEEQETELVSPSLLHLVHPSQPQEQSKQQSFSEMTVETNLDYRDLSIISFPSTASSVPSAIPSPSSVCGTASTYTTAASAASSPATTAAHSSFSSSVLPTHPQIYSSNSSNYHSDIVDHKDNGNVDERTRLRQALATCRRTLRQVEHSWQLKVHKLQLQLQQAQTPVTAVDSMRTEAKASSSTNGNTATDKLEHENALLQAENARLRQLLAQQQQQSAAVCPSCQCHPFAHDAVQSGDSFSENIGYGEEDDNSSEAEQESVASRGASSVSEMSLTSSTLQDVRRRLFVHDDKEDCNSSGKSDEIDSKNSEINTLPLVAASPPTTQRPQGPAVTVSQAPEKSQTNTHSLPGRPATKLQKHARQLWATHLSLTTRNAAR